MKRQLFLGRKPVPSKMEPIANFIGSKASGGLWSSTYNSHGESDWVEWCRSQDFWKKGHSNKWLLTISESARVLKVDSAKDLRELCSKYGFKMSGDFDVMSFDFEKISQDYDGLWLTERGLYETRYDIVCGLYGWDCESIHWFRWVFDKVESAGILDI